jgi:hypothetical protein
MIPKQCKSNLKKVAGRLSEGVKPRFESGKKINSNFRSKQEEAQEEIMESSSNSN